MYEKFELVFAHPATLAGQKWPVDSPDPGTKFS